MRYSLEIREKAIALRRGGASYRQIQTTMGIKFSKGILFHWCHKLPESQEIIARNRTRELEHLVKARVASADYYRKRRERRDTVLEG